MTTASERRKRWMRDVYSEYWAKAREERYGFLPYDRSLVGLVESSVPKPGPLLEVAVGTGWPFADTFARAGYEVHGVDISPDLVEECRRRNPAIRAVVGDAEHLAYPTGSFAATYSFHSTWYFPDLAKALDEMLRVTRPGGRIVFDLQNAEHPAIAAAYRRRLAEARGPRRVVRWARNLGKIALRRGPPVWDSTVFEVPTRPGPVASKLAQKGGLDVFARLPDGSLAPAPDATAWPTYDRLVLSLRKGP